MHGFIRMCNPAGQLFLSQLFSEERKRDRLIITRLNFGLRKIHRSRVDAGWSSGFESLKTKAGFL